MGNDLITAGGGDNTITADRGGSDMIITLGGDDTINAGAGNDWVFAGGGEDAVNGEANNDYLNGEGGRDRIVGGAGDDIITGGDGGTWNGDFGGDNIDGGDGNDEIWGDLKTTLKEAIDQGNQANPSNLKGDFFVGGAGDDWLIAGRANDVIEAGPGKDLVVAGAGNDTIDTDLVVSINALNWVLTRVVVPVGTNGIKDFISYATEESIPEGQDVDAGDADVVYAGKGDDWVYARGGDDFVDGGEGADMLAGGAGSDVLIGGTGDDYLAGDKINPGASDGDDYLDGGEGADTLWGAGGNDVLVGGAGDDILIGGPGKDVYVFEKGDGKDTVIDPDSTTGAKDAGILVLGEGFNRADIKFRTGSLLVDLGLVDPSDPGAGRDEIHFEGFNALDPNSTQVLGAIHFADGEVMTFADILAQGFDIDGTEEDDDGHDAEHPILVGTGVTDRMHGLGGDDIMLGAYGSDEMYGDEGDDVMAGDLGADDPDGGQDDFIDGGAGQDQIFGQGGDDWLFGGEGDDQIFGGTGYDTLSGGEGADSLQGGADDDGYVFGAGDTVTDSEGYNYVLLDVEDVYELIAVAVEGAGGSTDLVVAHWDATETAPGVPDGMRIVDLQGLNFDFALANEAGWYTKQMFLNQVLTQDLEVQGTALDDTISGFGGHDTVDGSSGDDTLSGGWGNDHLIGGAGGDLYLFSWGDGEDTITDEGFAPFGGADAGVDTLRFDVGRGDVQLRRASAGDLVLSLYSGGGQVTIEGQYDDGGTNRVERIEFGDGQVLTLGDLNVLPIEGTEGDDELEGTSGNETIRGLGGDDFLVGHGGNDTLEGGEGDDSYLLGFGSGQDLLIDYDGSNTIQLGVGLSLSDLDAGRLPDGSAYVKLRGNTDRVAIQGYVYSSSAELWTVEDSNGNTTTVDAVIADTEQRALDWVANERANAIANYKAFYIGQFVAEGFSLVGDGLVARNAYNPYFADWAIGDQTQTLTYNYFAFTGFSPQTQVNHFHYTDWDFTGGGGITRESAQFILNQASVSGMWSAPGKYAFTQDSYSQWVKIDWHNVGGVQTSHEENSPPASFIMSFDPQWAPFFPNDPAPYPIGTVSTYNVFDWQFGSARGNISDVPSGETPFFSPHTNLNPRYALTNAFDTHQSYRFDVVTGSIFNDSIYNADVVDAGDGDDFIWFGTFANGGLGNDVIDGAPIAIGGAGDDLMRGYDDWNRYLFNPSEAGFDYVADSGYFSLENFADLYYPRIGIPDWEEVLDEYNFPGGDGGEGGLSLEQAIDAGVMPTVPLSDDYGVLLEIYEQEGVTLDRIELAEGITPEDLEVSWVLGNRELLLTWAPDASITIELPRERYEYGYGIERVRFADGTVLGADDLMEMAGPRPDVTGTPGEDSIRASFHDELMLGLGGNDNLEGGEGNDRLEGGDGDDSLQGDGGNDHLEGDDGNDSLDAGSGDDAVYGGAGNDNLEGDSGIDILVGGTGNDHLDDWSGTNFMDGGEGDDEFMAGDRAFVVGGAGDDNLEVANDSHSVIAFNRGDGNDTVRAFQGATLSLGGAIDLDDLLLERDGSNVLIRVGEGDSIALEHFDGFYDYGQWPQMKLQLIVGGAVSVYDLNGLLAELYAQGEEVFDLPLADYLPVYEITEDPSAAYGGSLAYQYATTGGFGALSVAQIQAVLGDPEFGEAQPVVISSSEPPVVDAPIEDATVRGGIAFTYAIAGAFSDPDAGDVLTFTARLTNGAALPDWLSLDAQTGVFSGTPDPDDIGEILEIRVRATDNHGASVSDVFQIDIRDPFEVTEGDDIVDGTEGYDEIHALGGDDVVRGHGGDDWLTGDAGNDQLDGGGGLDYLEGGDGDDILDGGAGGDRDELSGGEGNDTYVFEGDFGWEYAYDSGGESDTYFFGGGIGPDDVVVNSWVGALIFQVAGTNNRVEVSDWRLYEPATIERVEFADGTVWTAEDVISRIVPSHATPLDDLLSDGGGDDVVSGLEGDDRLYAREGNDILFGAEGNDEISDRLGGNYLSGGQGDDTVAAFGGRNLLAGGAGADSFVIGDEGFTQEDGSYVGARHAVVAFNRGDGMDYGYVSPNVQTADGGEFPYMYPEEGRNFVLSLGGGIELSDLTLSRDHAGDWASLTIGFGEGEAAVMQSWYYADYYYTYLNDPASRPHGFLQIIDGNEIRLYDLSAAIEAFDEAYANDPEVGTWSAESSLEESLLSVSTTHAVGGALAYQYATTGSTDGLSASQMQSILANPDFASAAQSIEVEGGEDENDAPVVTAGNATLLFDEEVAADTLFSVADEDGDAITQYEFWDSTAGDGHWEVDGVEQAVNASILVSADDLDDVTFVASSTFGSDQVWVRAYDGEAWSAWKSWYVASAPHVTNAAPVIAAAHYELLLNDSVAATELFDVTDADGDAILSYEFWDDVAGGGYFALAGIQQGNNPITVSAEQLADLDYVAGAQAGTEQVWARASDGMGWGAWKAWNITSALHVPNAAPTISAQATQTVTLGEVVDASSFFGATDADGDTVVRYEFFDSTVGNGHFTVDGVEQGVNAGIVVEAADLADVQFVGSASAGSDLVWVRANDSQSWGEWKSWTVNSWPHATNAKPVAQAPNVSILTNQVVQAQSFFTVTDADGDAIASYEFWDDVAGGGYFRLDGVQQGAAQAITVTAGQLADFEYVGGASGGTEQVWVRANDGLEWSAWEAWNVTTALHIPNAAPVVTASNATVLLNDASQAATLFAVTDADSDTITKYEFWDSTAGNGHWTVGGVQQGVNVTIAVTAAQLSDTSFHAASAISSDLVWVRAHDGQEWSSWKSWTMQSSPHLTNAAPVVAASANGLLRNEAVSASSLFSVSDADADAITQYEFWDDVNGGGHWAVGGVQQAAAATIAVSAADLADATYVGGANAGTEQVWVRAYDGMAWSAWKNWLMSTEGGMLRGGLAPDTLNGEIGPTVLEGGGGDDNLTDTEGDNVLSGGDGDDTMTSGDGDDLIVGGAGNDTAHTGEGYNIIAYNQDGGFDTVYSGAGASNTLSLGGGLTYDDLSLSRDGDDLILNTGGDNKVAFKDWYAGNNTVDRLQMVLAADYDAGSADSLHNRQVQTFDFLDVVAQFDAAYAQSPGLSSWAMTNALLQAHLAASDEAAIGGDLAYWYGKNGALAGISLNAAQQVLASASFGSDAQTLRPFNGLQEGFVKLG